MQFETLPIILGVLIGVIGLMLVADAWIPDGTLVTTERRRKERVERNTLGEGLIGLSLLFVAAALIGRDRWRFGTVAVIIGTVAFAAGVFLNAKFLKEMLTNRGAARRHPDGAPPTPRGAKGPGRDPQTPAGSGPRFGPGRTPPPTQPKERRSEPR